MRPRTDRRRARHHLVPTHVGIRAYPPLQLSVPIPGNTCTARRRECQTRRSFGPTFGRLGSLVQRQGFGLDAWYRQLATTPNWFAKLVRPNGATTLLLVPEAAKTSKRGSVFPTARFWGLSRGARRVRSVGRAGPMGAQRGQVICHSDRHTLSAAAVRAIGRKRGPPHKTRRRSKTCARGQSGDLACAAAGLCRRWAGLRGAHTRMRVFRRRARARHAQQRARCKAAEPGLLQHSTCAAFTLPRAVRLAAPTSSSGRVAHDAAQKKMRSQ